MSGVITKPQFIIRANDAIVCSISSPKFDRVGDNFEGE